MPRKLQRLVSAFTLTSLVFSFIVIGKENVQAASENQFEPPAVSHAGPSVQTNYGKTALLFEENKGQTDKQAKFVSRASGYTLYLAGTEAVFSLKVESPLGNPKAQPDTLRMRFVGANGAPAIEGIDEAVTKTNYYSGTKRFENVPNYRKVNYRNLYHGIDAVFYGNQDNQLEYDFVVMPGGDANLIGLDFDGAENVSIDTNGNLVVKTANSQLVQQKPSAYQEIDGRKREIISRYVLSNGKTVSFELGDYDESQTLVIDPIIGYLTYLGGSSSEFATGIKVDANGNAYIAGATASTDFPGPNAGSSNINFAAFVSKISPDGQSIIYTTFLDGSNNDGQSSGSVRTPDLAIDEGGNAYIAGTTDSRDFPVTSNAFQKRGPGLGPSNADGFVTKLDTEGNIVYSTYLGGASEDNLHAIAVDSAGRAYVTGGTYSGITFPKKNGFQGTGIYDLEDAFLTVFNSDGSDILYSTGLGGLSYSNGNDIALDSSNNVYIVGSTFSNGTFPLRNSFQSANAGGADTFVAKFNTSLSGDASLIYSTFIGGGGTDEGFGIAVDASGQAHITGITGSVDFPLKNAFRSTNQINEAFVAVLNPTGNQLVNSSFLGGSDQDEGKDIALGNGGLIYVTGSTQSTDFPTALPFQAVKGGGRDAFVTKLKFGTGVMTSSFLGGNGNDSGEGIDVSRNQIFVTGFTGSINLATTGGVLQPNHGAGSNNADGFVAKILDTAVDSVGVFRPSSTFLLTQSTTNVVSETATFTSALSGQKGVAGDWNGDGITTIGSFTDGVWKIRNSNFPTISSPLGGSPFGGVTIINFGQAGDVPVVGDWNGDGIDTVGVYRPSTREFLLRNSNTSGTPNIRAFTFGLSGDLPIAGDWDGDGFDTIGVFRPSTGEFLLRNSNSSGAPDIAPFSFGVGGDLPVAGDWNGDGIDTVGVFRPTEVRFFLTNSFANIVDFAILFGAPSDQPLAGDWNGLP